MINLWGPKINCIAINKNTIFYPKIGIGLLDTKLFEIEEVFVTLEHQIKTSKYYNPPPSPTPETCAAPNFEIILSRKIHHHIHSKCYNPNGKTVNRKGNTHL